jgi:anaerobic magnesium-protoporphyrin IX monomethyl ester cyclase
MLLAPKIILTHGYFLEEDEKEKRIMKPYVPLGILYISAYLREHGYSNEVFDSTFSSFEKQKEKIIAEKPDFLCIYVNLMTKLNVLRLMKFVLENPETKGIKIILGGPEVRNHAEAFIGAGATAVVIGEGEESMLEILHYFDGKKSMGIETIKGIAWRGVDGSCKMNAERPLLKAIDELPFPARDAIDLSNYFNAWKNAHGESTISVSTMRGCPYTCKWCSRAVYGLSYRRRSAKLVVDELEQLKQQYNFDTIWFVDDVFTISHKWLKEFAEEVLHRKLKIRYEIISRADRMNEEVIDLLVASGCYRVWIGAESGSQKIIDAMDRRVDVMQVRQMIQLSRKKGLQAGTFIMLGYPGETEKEIRETIDHLSESEPDFYTLTIAYPIKGTPLYQEMEKEFIHPPDWAVSTDRDIDFKRAHPRAYYEYAVRWVYNEVAYRKAAKNNEIIKAPYLKLKSIVSKLRMNAKR